MRVFRPKLFVMMVVSVQNTLLMGLSRLELVILMHQGHMKRLETYYWQRLHPCDIEYSTVEKPHCKIAEVAARSATSLCL